MESEACVTEKGDFGNNRQMKKRFIDLCVREVNACGYQGNSLKQVSWDRIKEEIFEEFGVSFKQKDLKNKWDYLKRSYRAWTYLLNKSGDKYNAATGTFGWSQTVWDDIITQYPSTKKFRNRPLEYATELRMLFEGRLGTGDIAWGPARMKSSKSNPIDAPAAELVMDSYSPSICLEVVKYVHSTCASEQEVHSDVDASDSSGKLKRKANSEDIDVKAEVRDLITSAKDQVVCKRAKVDTMESEACATEKGGFGDNRQMKKRFIDLCVREVNTCGYRGNNLKQGSWDRIKKEIFEEFGLNFKKKDLKNKWDYLRRSYRAWTYLFNQGGNRYNASTGTFDWPQSVWDHIIRQYPNTKKFRNKPLEYANELRMLFGGRIGTGEIVLDPVREKLLDASQRSPTNVLPNEHASNPIDFPVSEPVMDSYSPSGCLKDVNHVPTTTSVSEQGVQSDVGTSRSSEKQKRETNSDDIDMKAEVRALIALIKDQIASERAKVGPSLDDCMHVMNVLLQEGSVDMRIYHSALLKFCECENYIKVFMGMQTLENRVYFLKTMVGGI